MVRQEEHHIQIQAKTKSSVITMRPFTGLLRMYIFMNILDIYKRTYSPESSFASGIPTITLKQNPPGVTSGAVASSIATRYVCFSFLQLTLVHTLFVTAAKKEVCVRGATVTRIVCHC